LSLGYALCAVLWVLDRVRRRSRDGAAGAFFSVVVCNTTSGEEFLEWKKFSEQVIRLQSRSRFLGHRGSARQSLRDDACV